MRQAVRIHTFENALTRTGHHVRTVPAGLSVRTLVDLAWDSLVRARAGTEAMAPVVIVNGTIVPMGTGEGDAMLDRIAAGGDEIHVAPGAPGDPVSIVLIVISVVSAVLSFALTPRLSLPEQPGDNAESRFGFQRYSRAAARGEPIPVVFGKHQRYGGVRVSELPGDGEDGDKVVRILLVLGEGPFNTIGNRTSDCDRLAPPAIDGIYLNDQPISSFPGARVSVRMGTAGQSMIPGFVDAEVLREVGAGTGGALMANTTGSEITGSSPGAEVVNYTTVNDVDAVNLRVGFPRGLFSLSPNGQVEARRVEWRYRTRESVGPGTWSAWTLRSIEKAEQSAFVQAVRVDNLSGSGDPAPFDVQVERVSVEAAGAGVNHADEMRLDSVVEIVYGAATYPDCALLAIELTASQQISSVPRVSVSVEGFAGCRIWDGVSDPADPAFTTGYSNNWADVALALITNERFGMGNLYGDDEIDFPGLLEARSNTPTWRDVAGGVHPFECNVILADAKDPIDWVRAVCACGRVTPVPTSKWMFVQSRARPAAVETFGDGSIAREDGGPLAMQISYPAATGGYAAPNQIRMQFKNADNAGETDLVIWPEAGDLWLGGGSAEPPNPKTVSMAGEMREGQAKAEAVYEVKRMRGRRSVVEFTTTRQAVVCQPAERIDVACSVAGWGESGRILAGATTQILLLDRDVEIVEGSAHAMRVRHLDGTVETMGVAMDPGVYAAGTPVGLAGELAAVPDAGAEFAVGVAGIEVKPFLVESVRATRAGDEGADYRWRILAGEYNEAVFDVTEADVPVVVYTNLGGDAQAPGPVTSLAARQRIVNGKMVVELSWNQTAADAAHTAGFVFYRRLSGTITWTAVPGLGAGRTQVDLTIVDTDRAYDFIVVARSPLGAQLSPYDPRHIVVSVAFGLGAPPPPAPTGLVITQDGGAGNVYTLSWDAVENAASYQVLAGGDTGTLTPNDGAEDCLVVGRTAATSMGALELPAGRSCTFYVRSVTAAGRLSFDAASVTEASPAAPIGESVKDTYVADLSSEGAYTNAAWDAGSSRAVVTDPTDTGGGVWESDPIDTGAVSLTEICLRPGTSNNAEDPDIDDAALDIPSIEADQWGVVDGSGGTAVVGMLMPPWPDDQQSWTFEVATSTDGATYTDFAPLAFTDALSATMRYYIVRAIMKRKTASRPYAPALRGIAVVCTH